MISLKEISFSTKERECFVNLTEEVKKLVSEEKIKKGICTLLCPHTTAGITLNEAFDNTMAQDLINKLNELIPQNKNYLHDTSQGEGNADSHLKAVYVGNSVSIPIESSELVLGTWQNIMFFEFDGPRNRKILAQFLKQ